METIYDWVTIAIFAAIIVLFLQRSTGEHEYKDNIFQYLGAAVGCAVVNYLGNEGYPIPAFIVLAGVIGYIIFVLKPFDRPSED